MIRARVILFDLDGVLVDSREAIAFVWRDWAARRGVDPEPFIRVAHGRRISETLRLVAPQLDIAAETAALDALEAVETRGLRPAPGAADLPRLLPRARWGIVTSAPGPSPRCAYARPASPRPRSLSQRRTSATGNRRPTAISRLPPASAPRRLTPW